MSRKNRRKQPVKVNRQHKVQRQNITVWYSIWYYLKIVLVIGAVLVVIALISIFFSIAPHSH